MMRLLPESKDTEVLQFINVYDVRIMVHILSVCEVG